MISDDGIESGMIQGNVHVFLNFANLLQLIDGPMSKQQSSCTMNSVCFQEFSKAILYGNTYIVTAYFTVTENVK